MEWSRNRGLVLRMAVTLALLGVVTCVFFGVVYGVVVGLLLFLESHPLLPAGNSVWLGVVVTGMFLTAIVYREYSGRPLALRFVDSRPTQSAAERSESLQRTVEQLAHQADLPVPTVVVADSEFPTSYTSGLTPNRATIVVTSALLDTLDTEEVRAVLAHELTHIKHRDVAVMTVASIPLIIARSIYEWADEQRKGDKDLIGVGVCYIVSGVFRMLGRLLIRSLSRYRELAADRGAVALTGAPVALVSAIAKLDRQLDDVPTEDLRAGQVSIEAFSIIPIDTPVDEPIRLGPNGDRIPEHHKNTCQFQKLTEPLFDTHPSMDRRLDQLREIETEL
ncbi:M48 family metalloprotease [Halocatena pleomorpha]|uniref:Heat-shock protein HtpX n=1 Tax=Halocatena pleomorpha TaxID=1785090 RepID=A0A3P3RBK4_9EURY|nr:M48 family metalloprotease [Halocatena pleomorpha]RRJ30775.1 heat-shock protein HtpX [Halocatena pleomorpha]